VCAGVEYITCKTEDDMSNKKKVVRYALVSLNHEQAKSIGEGKTTQVTRHIGDERWFLRFQITEKVDHKVEKAKVQLEVLRAKMEKLERLVGGESKPRVVVGRKKAYRRACPICHLKFRGLKLHIAMKHEGRVKSNLKHLKPSELQTA
jgi:hypothetical protein